ncbi:MAG: regulatory iron-sulfur-containing complex subunit RicT [Paludibacteraceae bacterium]|nr:regulatory iron-sulfur-containing complex subunit RicT [Paludibacteraceae bacterium]
MDYKLDIGGCCMNGNGCRKNTSKKLATFDWLCDLPETKISTDFVEVQFKNTRKGYFLNSTKIPLEKGDLVAVEASPGHDIGEVTLTGQLVLIQMKKNNLNPEKIEVRRVYRKARPTDLEKYEEAKGREQATMIRSRQIAEDLKLNMKIGDVEYQGDGNKAIFYYIADERVDFRQLIKVLADAFKVRIEMRQIGARQEAGRIGGIGPCGRELCCASWMSSFVSVSTSAARYQDISLNPQKLAGQCAKLKCCMNYEVDAYVDAMKNFPSKEIQLETKDGSWYHFKTDVFKGEMTYSSSPNVAANLAILPVERVKQVIAMNKAGQRPEKLELVKESEKEIPIDFQNVVGQDSLTRFDQSKKKKGGTRNEQNESRPKNRENRNRQNQNKDNRNERKPIVLKKKNQQNSDEKPTE